MSTSTNTSTKTAYVWGPVSNFSAFLLASLLQSGWQVHIPTKSALQISLSPLDLESTAHSAIEKALGSDKIKLYSENIHFLDGDELQRGTTYDIVIFCGLPTNFDEARVSRSPWAAEELHAVLKRLKGVPAIIVSSLWGGIQNDGVVPEEIEFDRRKAHTHFEGVCQQYEARILKVVSKDDCKWHLLRLPLILGSSETGRSSNFTGLYKLLKEVKQAQASGDSSNQGNLELSYNPDATLWMLPANEAADIVVKFAEDSARPSICNLVPTSVTLNQEWLHELAQYAGFSAIVSAEKDNLNLPGTLRSMLADNMQVKTRNLFEVVGRYHIASPFVPSRNYFQKICEYAAENNWGQVRSSQPVEPFSPERAQYYFEHFLPANLTDKMKKALASFKGGLVFSIGEIEECRWSLKADSSGVVSVDLLNPGAAVEDKGSEPARKEKESAPVNFTIAPLAFGKLTSGKLMFEQALVTKTLQVSGPPIQCVKACDFLRRFLRHHHYIPPGSDSSKVLEKAGQREG